MPKIIVTAEVKDPVEWEKGLRSHGDLFRSQTVTKPINFGTGEGHQVAICVEPDDFDTFMKIFESPATADAMVADGVKRETVRVFVLDEEFRV